MPFVGDNDCIPDRLELIEPAADLAVHWYCRVERDGGARGWVARPTTWVDKTDMTRSRSVLYAPQPGTARAMPEAARVGVGPTP